MPAQLSTLGQFALAVACNTYSLSVDLYNTVLWRQTLSGTNDDDVALVDLLWQARLLPLPRDMLHEVGQRLLLSPKNDE